MISTYRAVMQMYEEKQFILEKRKKEKSKKSESDALILITWKLFWHKSHS